MPAGPIYLDNGWTVVRKPVDWAGNAKTGLNLTAMIAAAAGGAALGTLSTAMTESPAGTYTATFSSAALTAGIATKSLVYERVTGTDYDDNVACAVEAVRAS